MRISPINYVNLYPKRTLLNQENNNVHDITGFKGYKLPTTTQHSELKVFYHHIYEFKKGLRSLVLTTEKSSNKELIEQKLLHEKIPYAIQNVNEKCINVFFGNEDCINVVSTFKKKLNELSPEQDFMLGIMLGYDKILQCKRYIKMLNK